MLIGGQVAEENEAALCAEIAEKDSMIMRLEQQETTNNVEIQEKNVEIQKLTLNLQHQTDSVETLNIQLNELKMQNEALSRNVDQLSMGMETVRNGDEFRSGDEVDIGISVDDDHEESTLIGADDDHSKMMRDIDRALRRNQKEVVLDIVSALRIKLVKSADDLSRSQSERIDLQQQVKDTQSEHQSVCLNNESLKNLLESHQLKWKNLQKKYQEMKAEHGSIKQMNEVCSLRVHIGPMDDDPRCVCPGIAN